MKRFLFRFLFVFCGWFIFASIVDYYVSKKIVASQARVTRVWNELFTGKVQADMIFLGSSKADNAYYPPVIDSMLNLKSYNLGLKGKLYDMDILRYHILKKYNNKTPKYIIWDVFHHTFNFSSKFYDAQFTPYLYDSDVWESIHNQYHDFTFFDRYVPLIKYYNYHYYFDYAFDFIYSDTNVIQGFVGDGSHWDPTNLDSLDYGAVVCCFIPESIKKFRNTITEMQKDGAKVILVYSPYYYGGLNKISLLDSLTTTFKTIADETNCIYLDFLNDEMCKDTTYFLDACHLNRHGAKVFSQKLAHTLDSLNIIQ